MLLIGSRAAKFWYPDFRQPKDIDLIVSLDELEILKSIPNIKTISSKHLKHTFKLNDVMIEAEIADYIPSSLEIKKRNQHQQVALSDLDSLEVYICKPEFLFLIKKSHITFNINWKKNFLDYHFLLKKYDWNDHYYLNKDFDYLYKMRYEETKERNKFKDHNFDKLNEDFFKDGVKRIVPHDLIHDVVKFYKRPLFESIKYDLTKAKIDLDLFNKLSYDDKLKNIAEEVMVLSIERVFLPMYLEGKEISDWYFNFHLKETLAKVCNNYLPFDFRMFAIDNFYSILDYIQKHKMMRYLEELKGKL
jgi:hypothetical protein